LRTYRQSAGPPYQYELPTTEEKEQLQFGGEAPVCNFSGIFSSSELGFAVRVTSMFPDLSGRCNFGSHCRYIPKSAARLPAAHKRLIRTLKLTHTQSLHAELLQSI
jgi:hypothetical protein